MLTRRALIGGLLAGAAAPFANSARGPRKPNVLLILADDLGYGETGCYGSTDIPTPNIDSIARNGIRFTNGYVSCPVCSPTRAGLLTGRYQQRFGHEFNPGPATEAAANFGLPLTEVTMGNRFKSLGYATGIIGKWHLGYRPEMHPAKRGFDEFYGFLAGAHSYLDALADRANPILRGTEPVTEIQYTTDEFAREAVSFIDRQREEPFFLYLSFNAVHGPLHATERYLARFESIPDRKRRTFAAMLSAMDDAIGDVLEKLRERRLEEETLIFFLSDNGGPTAQITSSNGPLRGFKGQVYEGGIRVPFMVQWKGRLPAGKLYERPVIALDILPTAIAAAGGEIPTDAKLDGVNLLPHLTGKNTQPPHDCLFWRFGPQSAVRMGDWKLVMMPRETPQLYNLATDIGEKNDLASKEPARVKELRAAFKAWNAQLTEPRWDRRARRARRRPQRVR